MNDDPIVLDEEPADAKPKRRWYTDEEKENALAIYLTEGTTVASQRTGIAKGTISTWAHKAGMATERTSKMQAAQAMIATERAVTRETLRSELIAKALDLLGRMDDEHIDYRGKDAHRVTFPTAPADACKHYATAAAILIDKYRLEMGEATDRTETLTPAPQRLAAMRDELEARRQGHAA